MNGGFFSRISCAFTKGSRVDRNKATARWALQYLDAFETHVEEKSF
jgi:hypothetical protein